MIKSYYPVVGIDGYGIFDEHRRMMYQSLRINQRLNPLFSKCCSIEEAYAWLENHYFACIDCSYLVSSDEIEINKLYLSSEIQNHIRVEENLLPKKKKKAKKLF